MNKSELSATIAKKAEVAKKNAESFTEAFIETITETLQKSEKVQIVGFGTFEVKERAARIARNPRTSKEIYVDESKAPMFKAWKML